MTKVLTVSMGDPGTGLVFEWATDDDPRTAYVTPDIKTRVMRALAGYKEDGTTAKT